MSQPLVIVTERDGPDGALHYMHVIPDWPSSGRLDYATAIELGSPGVTRTGAGAIFFYGPERGTMRKITVDAQLDVTLAALISFEHYSIMGFDAEPIWVSDELAFLLDEYTGQIASWNPRELKITHVDPIAPDVLEKDGFNVQFQAGVASGDRLFTAVSWRNWDTSTARPGVVLGVFDQVEPANGPRIIEDQGRCAPSASLGPFKDEEGAVYIVGDGALGFDLLASRQKTTLPQCVLRVRKDADEYDPDFFVDLLAATGSPAIYAVHPMSEHKLLVNMWSPDVDVASVADPDDSSWFWEVPPYYEYAIVDLTTGTSEKVAGLPRAGAHFARPLRVDDQTYVQTFREDRGSSLHRVDTDGTVTEVLALPSAANVQFIGRL